ncbi:hypothetical protein LUZ60_014458 [Juncus effusus]|nr:hypothetical protein LUZ60_014458 [Juncus effusus]
MKHTALLLPFSPIPPHSQTRLHLPPFPPKPFPFVSLPSQFCRCKASRARWCVRTRAGGGRESSESPYEVLGVSRSATQDEIKRAYRKLALKFHPDVNKEANAQERFMRIKHAYNALMNKSESRSYNGNYYSRRNEKKAKAEEEEPFYGLGDLFRDLQEEFRNWEADLNKEEKPKSLWEELAEIGEEFVEYLEKELNVKDSYSEEDNSASPKQQQQKQDMQSEAKAHNAFDEVEAALAQLKKELGL